MRTQNITALFSFAPHLPVMTLDPGKAQVLSLLPRISKHLQLAKEKALHFAVPLLESWPLQPRCSSILKEGKSLAVSMLKIKVDQYLLTLTKKIV